jgi:hypothetical protein
MKPETAAQKEKWLTVVVESYGASKVHSVRAIDDDGPVLLPVVVVSAGDCIAENAELRKELAEDDLTMELQRDAVRRATERWHAAGGRGDVRPDLADLIFWLLSEMDALREADDALAERAVKLCAEDMEDSGFTVIPNFKECVARARRELAAEKEQSDG